MGIFVSTKSSITETFVTRLSCVYYLLSDNEQFHGAAFTTQLSNNLFHEMCWKLNTKSSSRSRTGLKLASELRNYDKKNRGK